MKKLYRIGLILAIALNSSAFAQDWDWVTHAGGLFSDRATCVRADSAGYLYMCGYFNGDADFDGIPVTGYYDTDKSTFIAKYDTLGNCIWVRQPEIDWVNYTNYFDDRALGVAIDADGDVYIIGVFWEDIQLGPFYLVDAFGVSCCDQIYVAKLDSDGNWLWAHMLGSYADDQGQDIQVDQQGNVYITGYYAGTGTYGWSSAFYYDDGTEILPITASDADTAMFIAKLDTDGNFLWAEQIGKAYGGGRRNDLVIDQNSHVYCGAGFKGNQTISGTPIAATGGGLDHDVLVTKHDLDGNFVWVKTAGGSKDDRANGISSDQAGSIYLTGEFSDSAYFGTHLLDNYKKRDIFAAKMDTDGNWIWAKKAGSNEGNERGTDIYSDASRIYISGQVGADATFGSVTTNSSDSLNAFVARISPDGMWLWALDGGGISREDRATSVTVGKTNRIYTCGFFEEVAQFGMHTEISGGNKDIFLARIIDDYTWVVGMEEVSPLASNVYPNPFTNELNVQLTIAEQAQTKCWLTDVNGRFVANAFDENLAPGAHKIPVNLQAFDKGIYLLHISLNGEHSSAVRVVRM